MNDIVIDTQKYLSFPSLNKHENKVPRTLFEARKVAGSAKYKQSETVRACVFLCLLQFVY